MSTSRKDRDSDRIDRIVETIIYLQTEARRLAREQCQKLGVTATQLSVLRMLHEIGDLSLSELSRRIAAQNSTVTGIVDRMEQAKLVMREQSAEDRRVWRIRLSEKGREIARNIDAEPWDILRRALEALDEREKRTLVTLMHKVATHVETQVKDKQGE
ncbi:MAG: MarR family transcriptional regulator [Deltaproteobacteria bacterium]|nr:MarR family transcriptional regulator [Deltaproteobacteria bacterium]